MKNGSIFLVILGVIGMAFFTAHLRTSRPLDLSLIKIGMTQERLSKLFGVPSNQSRNQLTYILEDFSELTVTLRDQLVSSAKVKFNKPLQIEDPKMNQLTLVQMDIEPGDSRPGWFFAGNPEEGLIYKITARGVIESITWIKPFTYPNTRPKELQALYKDFSIQRSL